MADYTSADKARKRAASGKVKAAVWVGKPPITDDPFARVATFELVKDADAEFRRSRDGHLALGYEIEHGTLKAGLFVFRRENERVGIFLDKRR